MHRWQGPSDYDFKIQIQKPWYVSLYHHGSVTAVDHTPDALKNLLVIERRPSTEPELEQEQDPEIDLETLSAIEKAQVARFLRDVRVSLHRSANKKTVY